MARAKTTWLGAALLIAAPLGDAHADWPTCIKEGNVDRRLAACTEVIENGPRSARMAAHNTRAVLHLAKGELDLAEADLRAVLALPAKSAAEHTLHQFAEAALRHIAESRKQPAALRDPAPDPLLNETVVRLPLAVKLPSGATHKGEFVLTTMHPNGAGPFPAVIASHGYDGLLRTEMGRNRLLAPELVRRGFAVLAPTRIGHGVAATPENPERPRGTCETQDYRPAVAAGVAHIEATIAFAAQQPWIDQANLILLGGSAGGLYSLAAAGSRPPGVRAVVNFAGGEGGRLTHPDQPCNPAGVAALLAAAGKGNPIPTLWLYSENDKRFGPTVPRQWHAAYVKAGGKAEFHLLPPLGDNGHELFKFGRPLWMPLFDGFLAAHVGQALAGKGEILVGESNAHGVVFADKAGGFRILLPPGTTPLERIQGVVHMWMAALDDEQFSSIAYSDLRPPASLEGAARILSAKHDGAGTIELERQGLPGRELTWHTPKGLFVRWRLLAGGGRLYQVSFHGKPGSEGAAEAFLESFQLLTTGAPR
jgi:dienelactone hydrolase